MTQVMNSQSDAILAFEKTDSGLYGTDKPLNFLFSNLKCIQLFSYDFVKNKERPEPCEHGSRQEGDLLDRKLFSH